MIQLTENIVLWLILVPTTFGAAVLATMALVNVLRLRNVRLSWKTGKMYGYPLFSTLFLISGLLVGGIATFRAETAEMIAAGFYIWLGFCWFTTSYLVTKRFITDHGIVKNVNKPSQTVAWHQIRDFVEKETEENTRYIFIYSLQETDDKYNLIRLELDVPHKKRESFQKLISHKLGRRIRCYMKGDINVEQFE
ncbi:hypothetical protein [Fodinibius halophilus]|uniref:DUF5673 domain-containing protein n=1 Tax=Fodinibius halophilus TaxID=1736908 RepID=A0A6M1T6B1_9BACT|nr:hypothetical protein [Fodinibius halophilus]NGP89619.1 hypothetical protein [Fodinibius halophilus]